MNQKIVNILRAEWFSWTYFLFYLLPGYHFSNKLRAGFVGLFLKKRGKKFILNREVIIESPHNISIGDNVGINARCWISGGGGLDIEDNVLIGPGVHIITSNHNYGEHGKSIREQGHTHKPVRIENNAWIGAGTIILPGVTIGMRAVVGAGSIVTKSLEANGVYVGNPASKIKEL